MCTVYLISLFKLFLLCWFFLYFFFDAYVSSFWWSGLQCSYTFFFFFQNIQETILFKLSGTTKDNK